MIAELKRLFPSIPLVAEEDSSFLRSESVSSQKDGIYIGDFFVDPVVNAVADKVSSNHEPLSSNGVLEAIDKGKRCSLFWSESSNLLGKVNVNTTE